MAMLRLKRAIHKWGMARIPGKNLLRLDDDDALEFPCVRLMDRAANGAKLRAHNSPLLRWMPKPKPKEIE